MSPDNDIEVTPWGKLFSLHEKKSYDLTKPSYTIGRNQNNDIVVNVINISNIHCIISLEDRELKIKDVSTNGTYIDDEIIGYDDSKKLSDGGKFYLLRPKRNIGFKFIKLHDPKTNPLKRKREEEEKESAVQKNKQPKPAKDQMHEEDRKTIGKKNLRPLGEVLTKKSEPIVLKQSQMKQKEKSPEEKSNVDLRLTTEKYLSVISKFVV